MIFNPIFQFRLELGKQCILHKNSTDKDYDRFVECLRKSEVADGFRFSYNRPFTAIIVGPIAKSQSVAGRYSTISSLLHLMELCGLIKNGTKLITFRPKSVEGMSVEDKFDEFKPHGK